MECKMKFCQSCGMPIIKEEMFASNVDGSKNEDYCIYCYEKGEFKDNMTMEQMIQFCIPHMVKANPSMTEEEARKNMMEFFPTLKRWK